MISPCPKRELQYHGYLPYLTEARWDIPFLSYDVASGSEMTPCNKICTLVVYQFSGNVMTSITTLHT